MVAPHDCLVEIVGQRDGGEVCADQHVDEQQQKVLAVPETNAVVDPGAVVVHVQHAPIASRAVVASLWFEDVAH